MFFIFWSLEWWTMDSPATPGPPLPPTRKTGGEPVIGGNGLGVATLQDFWSWAYSNTLDNALRGILAEYLVGLALGVVGENTRVEWDAFDLVTTSGLKVEVKSTAYLQSWQQVDFSAPTFSIREARGWNAAENTWAVERTRAADVYVFCVFVARDRRTANPLDTRQWEFHVTSSARLTEMLGAQRSIQLSSLIARVQTEKVAFEDLAQAVDRAVTSPSRTSMPDPPTP